MPYDADGKQVGIGSLLAPKDDGHSRERFYVVDVHGDEVIAQKLQSNEVVTINPEKYVVTNTYAT